MNDQGWSKELPNVPEPSLYILALWKSPVLLYGFPYVVGWHVCPQEKTQEKLQQTKFLTLTGLRDRRQADHMGKTQDDQEPEDGVRRRL